MADIKLTHGAYVVVADGEKALFLKNEGDGLHPNLTVVKRLEEENPPNGDQATDRPGRFHDGPSPHKSAVAETDWHRLAKERFAGEISDRLYKMAHRGDFKDLILIAPPLVLGEMRQKLHKEVSARIRAEMPKTLTNHAVSDIEALFQAA